ncbi:MAG: hypothetical protein IH984_15515 [Planctomycetes bacterium]|nr:hypothetical protein [Planctomycetota bacterium]
MPNDNADNSKNDQEPEKASEAEILISRIVDHQANEQDQLRFEQLAVVDPSLWRTLAQQQQEMAALSDTVIEQLVAADRIELPTTKSSITPLKPFAFIGWAAAILIAAVWILLPAKESSQLIPTLTSDQHLDEYRKADFLKQEFDPIMLDWERINDDWIRIYYMRRFEESVLVNRPLEEIIAGDKFIVMPEELRKESPLPPTVNHQ